MNESTIDFESPVKEEYLSDFDIDDFDNSVDENYTSSKENSTNAGNNTSSEENLNDDEKIFIHESTIEKKKLLDYFDSDKNKRKTFIIKDLRVQLNRIDQTKTTEMKSLEDFAKNVKVEPSSSSLLSQWLSEPPKQMNFQYPSHKSLPGLELTHKNDEDPQRFGFKKTLLKWEESNETYTPHHPFLSHMLQHSSRYECDTCGKTYSQKAILRLHVKSHMAGYVKCAYCIFYYKPEDISAHLKNHSRTPTFKCSLCSDMFFKHSSRLKHMITVHTVGRCKYQCNFCPQQYSKFKFLKTHWETYHSKIIICKVCGLKQTKWEYKTHKKQHKTRRKTKRQTSDEYVCDICHSIFTWKICLLRHLRRHETSKIL